MVKLTWPPVLIGVSGVHVLLVLQYSVVMSFPGLDALSVSVIVTVYVGTWIVVLELSLVVGGVQSTPKLIPCWV